jgi:catechol 2,3-dioxygenase-like lactoylglutathione lyase family enzyme
MFHSTAMVPDYDRACDALAHLAGLRVLEYSEQSHPAVGRRGGMTWLGDNSIEIGQPIVPGGGAAKFVDRTGGGMHSVAVQVRDLPATIAHLQGLGVPIAAQPAPDFCFSDPRATGGVFFEWACLEMEEDPRFGAPVPAFTREPLL